MTAPSTPQPARGTGANRYYSRALRALDAANIPFLVAGAFALRTYTGIHRDTKDFDVFLRHRDVEPALAALREAGCRTEVTYPHWLAKAYLGRKFIDIIFNMANGLGSIDDSWFANAQHAELFGQHVRVVGPEEMIFSKLFTLDRGRYDGADVAHLLRALAGRLDWRRLLERAGSQWPVLLSHLVLFGYIYPAERTLIPEAVLQELVGRLFRPEPETAGGQRLCRGTALSPTQYLIDLEQWGYRDVRLPPWGSLTEDEVRRWTEGVISGQ
jgi:hypothetical protein